MGNAKGKSSTSIAYKFPPKAAEHQCLSGQKVGAKFKREMWHDSGCSRFCVKSAWAEAISSFAASDFSLSSTSWVWKSTPNATVPTTPMVSRPVPQWDIANSDDRCAAQSMISSRLECKPVLYYKNKCFMTQHSGSDNCTPMSHSNLGAHTIVPPYISLLSVCCIFCQVVTKPFRALIDQAA